MFPTVPFQFLRIPIVFFFRVFTGSCMDIYKKKTVFGVVVWIFIKKKDWCTGAFTLIWTQRVAIIQPSIFGARAKKKIFWMC